MKFRMSLKFVRNTKSKNKFLFQKISQFFLSPSLIFFDQVRFNFVPSLIVDAFFSVRCQSNKTRLVHLGSKRLPNRSTTQRKTHLRSKCSSLFLLPEYTNRQAGLLKFYFWVAFRAARSLHFSGFQPCWIFCLKLRLFKSR